MLKMWLSAAVAASAAGGSAAQVGLDQFAGRWEGAWFNDTFATTGAIVADVSVSGPTVTISSDVGGSVFGFFDPPPSTSSVTIGPDGGLIFGGGGDFFGSPETAVFDGENFSIEIFDVGDVGQGPSFGLMTVAGSVSAGQFVADYELFSSAGDNDPFAEGRIELTLIPVPGVASLVMASAGVGSAVRRRR